MNPKQFLALIKLRIRLWLNQAKKQGKFSYYASIVLLTIGILGSLTAFVFGVISGLLWFDDSSATVILVTWNFIAAGFLFFWAIGLMAELQQTELLSLEKLLHLPISLKGAFILNYMSCFLNASFFLFVPGMIGLAIGMTIAYGPLMLLSVPIIFSFLFLISALTYQLRGWLARVMENKRNKGNIIAIVTVVFVGLSQLPYFVTSRMDNVYDAAKDEIRKDHADQLSANLLGLSAEAKHGDLRSDQYTFLVDQMKTSMALERTKKFQIEKKKKRGKIVSVMRKLDRYIPFGWMPLGIAKLAEGAWIKSILGMLAMTFAGVASLVWSYRANMKRYTGIDTQRRKTKAPKDNTEKQLAFLYNKIPFASPHVSSVALSSFKSLLRSPEAKMMMMMPVILLFVFGSMFIGSSASSTTDWTIPVEARPWIPIGMFGGILFMISGFMFNVFGMDRDGFRAYMLSPISREELLVGKNLSYLPIAGGLCLAGTIVLQFIAPLSPWIFLAVVVQSVCVYLNFCLLGNYFSIAFPMGIKRGTMQPSNPKIISLLVLMLASTIGMSFMLFPSSVAFGIPWMLEFWQGISLNWLYLLLSLLQLAVTCWVYRWVLKDQADWLWSRETKILNEVANLPE
jgi:hypothetical protein